jgi:hypothetical protein
MNRKAIFSQLTKNQVKIFCSLSFMLFLAPFMPCRHTSTPSQNRKKIKYIKEDDLDMRSKIKIKKNSSERETVASSSVLHG